MDFKKFKIIVRAFVYGIFGLITAVVFVRLLLMVLGANPESGFVVFWYDFSNIFVDMFKNIYPSIRPENSNIVIETSSIVAMLFYLLLAFLTSKSLTSVASNNGVQIIKNIVDAIFKTVEFLLIARFLLKITGANSETLFVNFIYSVSAIVYEPFQGVFPTIKIENFDIVFETSTLLAIVIIIIFDVITEGIIDNLSEALGKNAPTQPTYRTTTPVAQTHATHQQPAPNITINVPQPNQQQAQPTYVDRRTVQVFPAAGNAPGYGQNHLENQRPNPNQQLPGGQQQHPLYGQNAPRNPNQGQPHNSQRG